MLYFAAAGVALDVAGRHVTAKIMLLDTTHSKGTHYRVTYAYPPGNPTHVENESINFNDWKSLKVGESIGLREITFGGIYRQCLDDPRIHGRGVGSACFVPFALLWNVIMCGIFLSWIGPVWKRRRLAKLGTPAMGKLTMKTVKPRKNDKTYTLGYSFVDSNGRPQVGTMEVNAHEFSEMADGQLVPVLYDPMRPHRSMIYGLGEYAAADDRGDELIFDHRT